MTGGGEGRRGCPDVPVAYCRDPVAEDGAVPWGAGGGPKEGAEPVVEQTVARIAAEGQQGFVLEVAASSGAPQFAVRTIGGKGTS